MTTLDLNQTVQNGRMQQGITPVYRPAVNGEELDITVSRLEMMMGESAHDQAAFQCTSPTMLDTKDLKGKAISFFFGLSPKTELFTGYIDTVQEEQSATGAGLLHFSMTCLGATKMLQEGQPRFWSNITIPRVVQNLANNAWLGFHGHGHPLSWGGLAQTEETDWKIISDLCKRIGFSLFNRYGCVGCYDPGRLLQENGSFITLVAKQYTSTQFDDFDRALVDFTPLESSDVSYRQMGSKLAYFNNGSVQSVTQRGDSYTTFKWLANTVARNSEEAEVLVNMTSVSASFWSQQATARVLGNAQIYPGMCVDIYTSNPAYAKDRYNGRWLVRGVQHVADRRSFQTQLGLSRPSSGFGVTQTPYVAFWNQSSGDTGLAYGALSAANFGEDTKLPVQPPKSKPTLTLYEGRWQSSWAGQVRAYT
jgi:hypothetical protein